MLSGTNLEYARQHNYRVVLETVRRGGALSRAELARQTKLSVQTVHNIVDALLRDGLLSVTGRRTGQRGQPATEVDLNPEGAYAVGLHLDRDHLSAVLVDLCGSVVHSLQVEHDMPCPNQVLPVMKHMISELSLLVSDPSRLWGIGIALPGPLDLPDGRLINPPNFPGWDGVNIRELLQEASGLPVFVQNDATASALGERWYGAGRAYEDFFYIFSGIGLGSGIVSGGQTFTGSRGNAGEIGHMIVVPGGKPCSCGSRGCLEQYASLADLYATLGHHGLANLNPERIGTLFAQRHPVLDAWLAQAAEHLVTAVVGVTALLNPQAIVFGGRLPDAVIDELISRVQQALPRYVSEGPMATVLVRAQISDDSASLGAATLPIYDSLDTTALRRSDLGRSDGAASESGARTGRRHGGPNGADSAVDCG